MLSRFETAVEVLLSVMAICTYAFEELIAMDSQLKKAASFGASGTRGSSQFTPRLKQYTAVTNGGD